MLEVYGGDGDLGYAYAYENRRDIAVQLVDEVLPRGAKLLDIAAAQGNFSLRFAERGYDVTWNDLREDLVGYVKLKHERGTIRFAPGNAFELEVDSLFDVVLITEVIEHVAHPDEFLARVAGLAKPGGYIVMTTPNGAYFRNPLPKFSECEDPSVFEGVQFGPNSDGHIFLLHEHEVRELGERAGLAIDKLIHFNNPLTHGHIKLGRALRVLPKRLVSIVESSTRRLPVAVSRLVNTHLAARFRVGPSR